jgi:hypothetical protein
MKLNHEIHEIHEKFSTTDYADSTDVEKRNHGETGLQD